MKNIDKILFKFKVFKLFLFLRFKDRKSDINDKRNIIKPSFKLNGLRIFKLKFSIDPKRIKVLIIKVVPPNILKVNFEILDLFFNDS